MRAESRGSTRSDEIVIRTAATAAIVAGGVYLTWRLAASLSVGTLWLGLPLLLGEIWGFSQLLILTFQGWNVTGREIPPRVLGDDEEPVAIPVIHSLDRPYRVEIQLEGDLKISGELKGFSLTPADESDE